MSWTAESLSVMARLCVEQWKLIQRFNKVIESIDGGEKARLASQIRYAELQLQTLATEASLKLVTFDGELFGPGSPASADNLDEFATEEGLIVSKTLEPAVISDMRVILPGRVLLDNPV